MYKCATGGGDHLRAAMSPFPSSREQFDRYTRLLATNEMDGNCSGEKLYTFLFRSRCLREKMIGSKKSSVIGSLGKGERERKKLSLIFLSFHLSDLISTCCNLIKNYGRWGGKGSLCVTRRIHASYFFQRGSAKKNKKKKENGAKG